MRQSFTVTSVSSQRHARLLGMVYALMIITFARNSRPIMALLQHCDCMVPFAVWQCIVLFRRVTRAGGVGRDTDITTFNMSKYIRSVEDSILQIRTDSHQTWWEYRKAKWRVAIVRVTWRTEFWVRVYNYSSVVVLFTSFRSPPCLVPSLEEARHTVNETHTGYTSNMKLLEKL